METKQASHEETDSKEEAKPKDVDTENKESEKSGDNIDKKVNSSETDSPRQDSEKPAKSSYFSFSLFRSPTNATDSIQKN